MLQVVQIAESCRSIRIGTRVKYDYSELRTIGEGSDRNRAHVSIGRELMYRLQHSLCIDWKRAYVSIETRLMCRFMQSSCIDSNGAHVSIEAELMYGLKQSSCID